MAVANVVIPDEIEEGIPASTSPSTSTTRNEFLINELMGNIPEEYKQYYFPPKRCLASILMETIQNRQHTDTIVKIGTEEFKVHHIVLECYSKYFEDHKQNMHEFDSMLITQNAFRLMYDWMISTDKTSYTFMNRENIVEILCAAKYLGVPELEEQCWIIIDNVHIFYEFFAYQLYMEAKKFGVLAIQQIMIDRIRNFFLPLVSSKDFLDLDVDIVSDLLKSNHIKVNCEMEVFLAAVRWLFHDWNKRKQYAVRLMSSVRFGLIHPHSLVAMNLNHYNPKFVEVVKIPEVAAMRSEGLSISIMYYGNNHTRDREFYYTTTTQEPNVPIFRQYHDFGKIYNSLQDFLDYLNIIRVSYFDYWNHHVAESTSNHPEQ